MCGKGKCGCDSSESCGCGCGCSGGCSCGTGCSCEGGFKRRYQTRAEKIAELEEYLKDLKAEAQAVTEELAHLKRKK